MDILKIEDLKQFMDHHESPCVSLYMPTHKVGLETRQNAIRFKNLLNKVETKLNNLGLRPTLVQQYLDPARKLIKDNMFWQHQSEGLVVFLCPETFTFYKIPISFEETLYVGDRFYLKPLLPLLSGDGRFFILALSQNKVRLFAGSRHSIDEIAIPNVPSSKAEAIPESETRRQVMMHSVSGNTGGGRSMVFHGQGIGMEQAKEELLRFFRMVDEGLQVTIKNERIPMVIAGVDYLIPLYRKVNRYPYLLEKGLIGNPDELSPPDLQIRAWNLVEPLFRQEQQKALLEYQQKLGTGLATRDTPEILKAACSGRVDVLFVAVNSQLLGHIVTDKSGGISLDENTARPQEDILDYAAYQTLRYGGVVYALEKNLIPEKVPLAAIYRY